MHLVEYPTIITEVFMFTCLFLVFYQTGLRPVDFWGNCYMSNTTDVELAMIDPHKVGSVSNLSIFFHCLRAKN